MKNLYLLIIAFFSFACQGSNNSSSLSSSKTFPEIKSLEQLKSLVDVGLEYNGYFYSILSAPIIRVPEVFESNTDFHELQRKESDYRPFYDSNALIDVLKEYYYHPPYKDSAPYDNERARDEFLKLLDEVQPGVLSLEPAKAGQYFVIHLDNNKNNKALPHSSFLVVRREKLKNSMNADQLELAIRVKKKADLIKGKIISFDELASNNPVFKKLVEKASKNQREFLERMTGLRTEASQNYFAMKEIVNKNITPLEVTPFIEYCKQLSANDPVQIIVGRGQLTSRSDKSALLFSVPLLPNSRLYSINIDPTVIPDLVADVTNLEHMKAIPDGTVDDFFFDGVTYDEVYTPELFKILCAKLKKGGRFITTFLPSKNIEDLQKKLSEYFEFKGEEQTANYTIRAYKVYIYHKK